MVAGRLRSSEYRPRLLDEEIKELMELFGAVKIEGPKYCGKTWSARAHANSEIRLDREEVRNLVMLDHRVALEGEGPRLIDEWQEIPGLHDDVRREVDDSGRPGLYLLTGSSLPPQGGYSHSGAGRIARVQMRTESLLEQELSTGAVSIAGLFEGENHSGQAPGVAVADVASWVCRGGWPAMRGMSDRACTRLNTQYLNAVLSDDVPRKGLESEMARNCLRALARTVATAASYTTLGTDMAHGEAKRISDYTVRTYLDFFRNAYLIEELPGWDTAIRSKKHLRTKPKRYFTDSSLAARILGISAKALLGDTQLLGLLFENLVIRDLRVYLSAHGELSEARLSYYADDTGLEVDAIIQLPDQRWGALEIKLSDAKVSDAASNLLRLKALAAKNGAARVPPPSFLAVITGLSPYAYTTPEGIQVVPISMLGP